MGNRSSDLRFLPCFLSLLLLLLSGLPSGVMYATSAFIIYVVLSEMGNVGEDKAAQMASAAKQKQDVEQARKQVNEARKRRCPIHRRSLVLKNSGAPHECKECRDQMPASSYCCKADNCNYIVHQECAKVDANKSPAPHRFFKNGEFKFFEKKTDDCKRVCTACGNGVRGCFYHWETTTKYLHPCCLKLKDSVLDKEGQVLKLREKAPKRCQICEHEKVKDNIKGWAYVSPDKRYCFHVSCVKGLILDKWKKGYFSPGEMSLQRYDSTTRIPLTCKEMVKARRSSKGWKRKTKVFIKIANVAVGVILSVVSGNPAPLIATIGAMSSN